MFVQVVAYDGSQFAGFQFQPKARTVQGELEKAAARVLLPAGRVVGGLGRVGGWVGEQLVGRCTMNVSHIQANKQRHELWGTGKGCSPSKQLSSV